MRHIQIDLLFHAIYFVSKFKLAPVFRLMLQRASLSCALFSPPQGISIRPLIEFINVRRTNRNVGTINVEVHCRVRPRGSRLPEC